MKFTIRALAIVLLSWPLLCGATLRIPNEEEVEGWLKQRSQNHSGLASKAADVQASYEVVFIPGILASKLHIDDYTFGEDEIRADKLVFDPAQKVEAATLNQFKARVLLFSRKVDIYGGGLDRLMQALGGKPAFEFSYDWRNDIDVLADRLQQALESQLSGKRVILVAHSMGGVIGWHWKNKYPPRSNKVKLVGMVLLGSPLQGSCEPARMLVEGYGAPDGAGSFEKVVTRLVFSDAHPAIFTFPSVFQLLPRFDSGNPCIRIKSGNSEFALKHHEPATWLGRPGGSYGAARKFHAAVGLSESEYARRVQSAIEAGRRFRDSFNLSQDGIQTYLLYSKARKLRKSYLLDAQGDWLTVLPRQPDTDGDGRVPVTSARNSRYFDLSNGSYWPLSLEHGELLSDEGLSEFVENTLRPFMTKLQHVELISYALDDPILRKEIEAFEWLPDPTVRSRIIIQDPEIRSAQQAVAEFNAKRATGAQDNLAQAVKARGREIEPPSGRAKSASGNNQAAVLYKTALVLDPDNIDARTLNRLGYIQIHQKRYREAVAVLTKASDIAKVANDPHLTPEMRNNIKANLSFAKQQVDAQNAPEQPGRTSAMR